MAAGRYNRIAGARPLSTPEPETIADVFTTNQPDIFHVRILEIGPGGEVIRQANHRLRAANAQTAGVASLWLARNSHRFECAGFFQWR